MAKDGEVLTGKNREIDDSDNDQSEFADAREEEQMDIEESKIILSSRLA